MDFGLRDRRALVTAASRGLGRACAETLIAEGARVFMSSRHPEATAREIGAAGWSARDVSKPGDRKPMKRLGMPEEFAAACVFLCSRQAAYITGQTLGVDGGALVGVH